MLQQLHPYNDALWKIVERTGIPDLSGSGLVVGWDGRSNGSYAVDCFWFSNQASIDLWEPERKALREKHLRDTRGIEYKKLHSDGQGWRAFKPSLEAAVKMNGMCLVVMTELAMELERTSQVTDGLAQMRAIKDENGEGLLRFKDWKTVEFVRAMRMVNLLTTMVGRISKPGQAVRWHCDEDNIWGNADQKQDVRRMLERFCTAHVPHALGPCAYSTYKSGGVLSLEAKDFTCLADNVVGGVSDTIQILDANDKANTTHFQKHQGDPGKAEILARWFWNPASTNLKRLAIRIMNEGPGKASVSPLNVVFAPPQRTTQAARDAHGHQCRGC